MSAGDGIARGRYRFAEWTLSAVDDMTVRYVGKCLECWEHCVDTATPDAAQVWCLKHAGATKHGRYQLSGFQYFDASMTEKGTA